MVELYGFFLKFYGIFLYIFQRHCLRPLTKNDNDMAVDRPDDMAVDRSDDMAVDRSMMWLLTWSLIGR